MLRRSRRSAIASSFWKAITLRSVFVKNDGGSRDGRVACQRRRAFAQARTQLEDLPESRALESLHLFADTITLMLQSLSRASGLNRRARWRRSKFASCRRKDRPREKLLKRGADALTNRELIAILLRTGVRGKNAVEVAARFWRNTRR